MQQIKKFLPYQAADLPSSLLQRRIMAQHLNIEVILECGSEGGSLSILGIHDAAGNWKFFRERNESALLDMLDEEDRQGLQSTEARTFVTFWEEALKLIDPYRWHRLFPVEVHPQFLERVLEAVESRGGCSEKDRWKKNCSGN